MSAKLWVRTCTIEAVIPQLGGFASGDSGMKRDLSLIRELLLKLESLPWPPVAEA
jgi:hypothetical protein